MVLAIRESYRKGGDPVKTLRRWLVASIVALAVAASPVGRWEGLIGGPAQLNVNYTFAV